MNKLVVSLMQLLVLGLICQSVFAESIAGENSAAERVIETDMQTPYVSLNIGVEINGLAKAVENAAEGLTLIGESLQNMVDDPDLTPQRQENIDQALMQVDALSVSLVSAIDRLPMIVEGGMAPVVKVSNDLSSEIKKIIIVTSAALILIILIALVAVYYFVLAPGAQSIIKTASLLDDLAKTLKTTAEIVEIASEQNLRVIEEMRVVQKRLTD